MKAQPQSARSSAASGDAGPSDAIDVDFSDRLRALLLEQNITAAELARLIQEKVPRFGVGNVSHYLCQRSFPRPPILNAISEILHTDLSDYAARSNRRAVVRRPPTVAGLADGDGQVPLLNITDTGDGEALLQINQKLPWPLALKILQTIRGE